jgi:glycosyltransferase involved in cell wall biosynthesis
VRRHDVVIYAPRASSLYERSGGRAGGAERQMVLLAWSLAAAGYRVAHIVYPVRDAAALPPRLTLVARRPHVGERTVPGRLREARRIWGAFDDADASILIVRSGTPVVGLAGLYSRVRRRRLIFSGANNSDFTRETFVSGGYRVRLYDVGVRLADAVVVQSEDQRTLAQRTYPQLRRVVKIPSFAEADIAPAPVPERMSFLWAGRCVDYKRPLCFVELARAVPEARFVMIAVPEGDVSSGALLERLRSVASEVPNLELLPPIPRASMAELISCAVAVVNTSRLEGMPNVFLEAWAAGVPVLTLEFDPDGIIATAGLGVAAGGSWDDFVEGARALWAGRATREGVEERTRAYVRRVHGIPAVTSQWEELIASLR